MTIETTRGRLRFLFDSIMMAEVVISRPAIIPGHRLLPLLSPLSPLASQARPVRISDEEEDGAARKKLRLTKEQSALLEDKFKEHATLNTKQKQALARQLNLRPRQVEVWFQNRRARTKLKKTEVECEFLRKCCETLREENRRLLQEIQDLKSLDFQAPRYMQPPRGAAAAATFQTCPSCKNRGEGGSPAAAPKTRFFNPFAHSAAN
ncbi:homeobox-leucine zipper protein [Musa troglodytarum]|uniref:Homeobox-leucine zipper protein n=1 Tax=Musa troglodytarum TaxID=320322 RepID=A0A9E7H7Q9_9LILI|nr:homeobox-leucine zipper protein [Musa troglodytarum]URE29262.1 homeobox-leucine zipper protein [Musa troglodytarum]